MNEKLFTVAVVTYNEMNVLPETIRSILAQPYPAIELVICDNESCDFDENEIRRVIEQEKTESLVNLVIYRQEKHVSETENAEKARQLSSGAYFKLLRGGDMLAPDALSTAGKAFSNREDCSAVIAKYQKCDRSATFFENDDDKQSVERENITGEVCPPDMYFFHDCKTNLERFLRYATMNCGAYTYAPQIFWRAKCLEDLGGYDTGGYSYLAEWPALLKLCESEDNGILYLRRVCQYSRAENTSDWWAPMSKALGRPELVECSRMLQRNAEPVIMSIPDRNESKKMLRRCRVTQETLQIWEKIQCEWDEMGPLDRAVFKLKHWRCLLFVYLKRQQYKPFLIKSILLLLLLSFLEYARAGGAVGESLLHLWRIQTCIWLAFVAISLIVWRVLCSVGRKL